MNALQLMMITTIIKYTGFNVSYNQSNCIICAAFEITKSFFFAFSVPTINSVSFSYLSIKVA